MANLFRGFKGRKKGLVDVSGRKTKEKDVKGTICEVKKQQNVYA